MDSYLLVACALNHYQSHSRPAFGAARVADCHGAVAAAVQLYAGIRQRWRAAPLTRASLSPPRHAHAYRLEQVSGARGACLEPCCKRNGTLRDARTRASGSRM